MSFYFNNTNKVFFMSEEAENHYRGTSICRFCEKEDFSDKIRNDCPLPGKYRGPAHHTYIINATQKLSNFVPIGSQSFW